MPCESGMTSDLERPSFESDPVTITATGTTGTTDLRPYPENLKTALEVEDGIAQPDLRMGCIGGYLATVSAGIRSRSLCSGMFRNISEVHGVFKRLLHTCVIPCNTISILYLYISMLYLCYIYTISIRYLYARFTSRFPPAPCCSQCWRPCFVTEVLCPRRSGF